LKDSIELVNFFNAAKKLANIPGVQNFECLRQISTKNQKPAIVGLASFFIIRNNFNYSILIM